LLGAGGLLQRIVAVDVHSPAIEGFFGIPLEHLSAVPLLVESVHNHVTENSVIVAPDLGASKLAERYARPLGLPVAIVQKSRLSGSEVSVRNITGNVRGCAPIIVDDMISTGGTVAAAIESLLAGGSEPYITVVASHGLFVGPAVERLSAAPLKRIVVTRQREHTGQAGAALEVVGLAPLLARAVNCLHNDRSLEGLLTHA
jgi:ribose-phosphate pyrophosphokinase